MRQVAPSRVRLKRERDAADANRRRSEAWSEAARPVLELLRRRRHKGNVSIEAVEAALLAAAEARGNCATGVGA